MVNELAAIQNLSGFANNQINNSITNIDNELTNEEVNNSLAIKRELTSDLYTSHNANAICNVVSKNSIKEESFSYVSQYTPNAEATLTKMEIENLVSNSSVESIYERENIYYDNYEVNLVSSETNGTDYSDEIYDITGIAEYKARSVYNNGSGVKIGSIDWGLPDTTKDCFSTALTDNRIHTIGAITDISNHSTLTSSIILGEIEGVYEGIAPKCELYCVATGDPNKGTITWKDKIELLISPEYNVNIINSSFEAYGDGRNNYGDSAKWLDMIINTQNVTFIQAAANTVPNADSIISGGMAYNSIVVGNYDIATGEMASSSSYNTGNGTYKLYKPDISAPSALTVYYSQNETTIGSGTSCATPVVTGIVALLCQGYSSGISSILPYPMFIKSLLINGATPFETEHTSNANDNHIIYTREGGVGIANIQQSRLCLSSRSWSVGTFNSTLTEFSQNLTVSVSDHKSHVTFCSMKPNTIENGVVTNSSAPLFQIEVSKTISGTEYIWSSYTTGDTKTSVFFTPPVGGTYTVTVKRFDGGTFETNGALVATSGAFETLYSEQ